MSLSRTDENELLTALHGSIFHDMPWHLFLSRLRARTEADLCSLVIRPAGEATWTEVEVARARGTDAAGFVPPAFDMLRPGRVYSDIELAGKGEARARHIRVSWPEGGDLAVSLYHAHEDFRARDAALLASLAPHLTIALRAHIERDAARRRDSLAEAVLADFAMAWLLLDARGRVLDCDPAAARLIEEGRVMRRAADGRLRCSLAEAEAALEQAIADPIGDPRAAWLDVDRSVQMVTVRPSIGRSAMLAPPHCLMLVREPRQDSLGGGRYLQALFRLTRREAALAARIAEGDSLTEAARTLGLTIETARNYSKRIYMKTGARGQGDVVRILLNGVGMLG